jgi:hypothetical protein
MRVRTRAKKVGIPKADSLFTEDMLLRTAKDLKSGRWPSERVRFADDVQPGLRAVINQSGLVTYHAQYEVDGKKERRGYMKIGDANPDSDDYISLTKARARVKTIKALADKGIDVQDGLHKRLLKELDQQGADWEPK